MKSLLYIDCCIRRELSRTRMLADAFLERVNATSKYAVESICLMDEPLTCLSEGFFAQREVLLVEGTLDHPRFRYAQQFSQADAIVVAAPFWDLSFPALLKVYIENVCVQGISFDCDETGTYGICKAERLLFLTSRGGNYQDSALEMGVRYLEALCEFWGIGRFDSVAADGLDLGIEPVEAILQKAVGEALVIAGDF